jgi:hypothetical protein
MPFSSCKVLCHHFQIGKDEVLADGSGQAWLGKIPSSVGAACSIDQLEERKSVIFQVPSDGTDGTEGERLSTDCRRG